MYTVKIDSQALNAGTLDYEISARQQADDEFDKTIEGITLNATF